ncbi:MAG: hypothetical protein H0V18_10300 [Pyrinomonadaceae bacterium]|nr:hypothetical protein [Pyrinomonadaceae bacterium]
MPRIKTYLRTEGTAPTGYLLSGLVIECPPMDTAVARTEPEMALRQEYRSRVTECLSNRRTRMPSLYITVAEVLWRA